VNETCIREFQFERDYEAAIALWQRMEKGVHVSPSDAPEEIQKKLERDPDLFLVAESGSELIGSVIGGFDGRRGFIYHLAVDARFRGHGLGGKLMDEVEKRLRAKGCLKCYLFVTPDNPEAMRYYEHRGWELMHNAAYAKEWFEEKRE
jgi:ribosomal protein S18 acetylase RimI-like enzyme